MDIDMKDVGQLIRRQRERLNMSQKELAEMVGYKGRDMISRIESGEVVLPMDKLVKIAGALGLPPSAFFFEELSTGAVFHTGKTIYKNEPDPLQDALRGLDADEIERVIEYIKLIKGARLWQQQNGTEPDGGFESR